MKDEHDKNTAELIPFAPAGQAQNARREEQGINVTVTKNAGGTRQANGAAKRKPFNVFRAVQDDKSYWETRPKCAKLVIAPGMHGGHFVPVSFVAKDWKVTPRRIRFLLAGGRLAGRLLDNGYWEVRFPYQFTFGTRGPGLRRQEKPKKQERMKERTA